MSRVYLSRASRMSPTPYFPHGSSLLCEDCSSWFELSVSEVKGVPGFLAKGSPPSPSGCGCFVF